MTSLPYGAMANDTGEFMLGRIVVTPVLLESNGTLDANVYDWTASQKSQAYDNVVAGMEWWNQLLAKKSSVHTIDWVFDRTYLDNPVPTRYEPIKRISDDYSKWVPEFLTHVNFNQESSIEGNIRRFNDSQRQLHQADWSFTIFIVNSASNELFAPGGSFSRAFAFAGGLYFVTPSNRPASTYAHETGHMFWARDEYPGGGNYNQKRGYYNSQNSNAVDLNPTPGFQQAISIMSAGTSLDQAYDQVETSAATLAQIGWRDSDNDGIFDVLDVPIELSGVGSFQSSTNEYRFAGSARVQTLANLNSSGLQNDITINKIGRYEYRLNGTGSWTTLSTLATPVYEQQSFELRIALPANTSGFIEIRAVDPRIGITSNIFRGDLSQFDQATTASLSGFVWSDTSNDGLRQLNENGIAGWSVQLVNAAGSPIDLQTEVEPDNLPASILEGNEYAGITLRAVGIDADGTMRISTDPRATTGTRVFSPYSFRLRDFIDFWRDDEQNLEARFNSPQGSVTVDVFGAFQNSYARLEAYSSTGVLLERVTSEVLASGQKASLTIQRNQADIAYVLVKGHLQTSIGIDNLRFGVTGETTTGPAGDYRFDGLLPGTYYVKAIPTVGSSPTAPSNGIFQTTVIAGESTFNVDLGFFSRRSPWQNPTLNVDVNNDGLVSPIDVLQVINALSRNGSIALEGSSLAVQPFVDVDGNRSLAPLDVLVVINYLRRLEGSSEGEASRAAPLITQGIEEEPADGELPPAELAHLYLGEHAYDHVETGSRSSQPSHTQSSESTPIALKKSSAAPVATLLLSRRRYLTSSVTDLDAQLVDAAMAD
jgi:hypothetical protein